MSKEFALEQSSRNRSAVELYKRPLLTPAAFMDGARNQFLSRWLYHPVLPPALNELAVQEITCPSVVEAVARASMP